MDTKAFLRCIALLNLLCGLTQAAPLGTAFREAHRSQRNERRREPTGTSLFLCLLCGLLFTGFCLSGRGQNYSIDWSTLDGGGGTSTGGVYTITGTIGQPDAGTMSGGNYTLQGGFWGVIAAVQTEGAPFLSVTRTNNTVIVSWPLPATGWLLHATTNLVTAGSAWTEIPPPYQTNDANLQYTEPLPTGRKFYRLHKP